MVTTTACRLATAGVLFMAIAENPYQPPVVLPDLGEIAATGGADGRPAHP
jgi:hypothetical protein